MQSPPSKATRQALLSAAAIVCLLSNIYLIYLAHNQFTSSYNDHPATSSSNRSIDQPQSTTAINSKKNDKQVPDWHLAIDCSVFDISCPSSKITEGRYEPYPFPLSRHIKNLDAFHHHLLSGVPTEWMDALNVDNSLERPPSRSILYSDAPAKVPSSTKEECMKQSLESHWKIQIDNLLFNTNITSRLKREPTTNMIAYTISDYNYAYDMMQDVFTMNSEIVGFDASFFMVALDLETLEMACEFGYPVVAWPSARPEDGTGLKEAVAFTKFEVSLYLIERGFDFFFYEMDVWFLKSPIELIAEFHSHDKQDILASSHVKDPLSINIGVFSISANKRTKEYFELCLLMGTLSPDTHDQWIMGQLLLVAYIMHSSGGKSYMKLDREWKPPPPPEHNPPNMTLPPHLGLYSTMEIMSGAHPYPTKNTIAIHTLTKTPLKKPFGKKILAKELGAWTGAAGYYSKCGTSRRFLMMDGHDSPNSYSLLQTFEYDTMDAESMLVHSETAFKWTIAVLLALARRTGRIFIMPKVIYIDGSYFLWSMLDFEPVKKMQIEFRETNFPHNKKSWYSDETPFRSAARTALAPLTSVDKEGTMYAQLPNADINAWKFSNTTSEAEALDTWWALHTAIPEIDSSELLLVNPHFMSSHYARDLTDKARNTTASLSVAEREITNVYKQLKWCLDKSTIVNKDNIIGRSSAESACQKS